MPARTATRSPTKRRTRVVSKLKSGEKQATSDAPKPASRKKAKLKSKATVKTTPKAVKPSRKSAAKSVIKTKASKKQSASGQASPEAWTKLRDPELLNQRICDLNLSIKGSKLQKLIDQLHGELSDRGLKLKPHCWLSDDWFSPDGIPGIAIPFYMAHPRLMRLERSQMLEVEGGTQEWCMRILRHEAGHAIDTAFRLHRRKRYREIFGRYADPYPEYYHPKPKSKSFVLHLEPWYAQSHPSEDFAETFAVWLQPNSRWRTKYAGWKALKKIEFVDQLMEETAGQKPKVKSRVTVDPVRQIKKTLRQHYKSRHVRYEVDMPGTFDHDLKKLFPQTPKSRKNKTAAAFLQRNRAEFSRVVSQWSGEYQYNINQVLREMIERCRAMDLRVTGNETKLKQNALVMLSVHAANYLHGGHHRVAL